MSTWHGVMADGEEFMRRKISTNTVYGCKTDTKCAHCVRGRPTLKDEERFRNGLVHGTFMSEPFIEKMLYQLSYVMLIERSINSSLIVYVDAIVNQAEYQQRAPRKYVFWGPIQYSAGQRYTLIKLQNAGNF